MAVFTVDSDAVLSSTGAVRATIERIQAETAGMLGQLTQLQSSWTGSASIAFGSVVDQWRLTQRQVEDGLAAIGEAMTVAATQYADAETANASLFR